MHQAPFYSSWFLLSSVAECAKSKNVFETREFCLVTEVAEYVEAKSR
jgi:hypothetical protein